MAGRHFNVNRYRRRRYHKRVIIRRFEKHWDRSRLNYVQILDKYRDDPWMLNEIKPWKIRYLTGPRQHAKYGTDRRIRQRYRTIVITHELEDIIAPQHSDYRKEYDYSNDIW